MMNNMFNPMMMNMNMNNLTMMNNMMNFPNNNFQNNNTNISKGKKKKTLGRLPRDKITDEFSPSINMNNNSMKYNIIFATPAGHRVIITTPIDIKIYDLLCLYMERVSLGPKLIGNGI